MDEFTEALDVYDNLLAAWIIAASGPQPVDNAEWSTRADAARSALIAAHEAAVEAARPIPPALSVADSSAMVDDLIGCASIYDDRAAWRNSDLVALGDARDGVIAALTGRATDAALAEAEARGRAAALAEVDAAVDAVDAFVGEVLSGLWSDNVDGFDLQDCAEAHGIIVRVECGGAEAECPICVECDSDYHYERVLWAGGKPAAAALTGREGGAA